MNTIEAQEPNLLHVKYDDLLLLLTPDQLEGMLSHMALNPYPHDFTHLGTIRAIKIDVDLTGMTPEKSVELIQFMKDDPLK